MQSEGESADRGLQLAAIEIRGNWNSIFRRLHPYVAGFGGHDAFRNVRGNVGVLGVAGDDALDSFEFLQRTIVPMLIFDSSEDQRVNLIGSGGWISRDGCALAAGARPRDRSA
jgi:hypothetical protein